MIQSLTVRADTRVVMTEPPAVNSGDVRIDAGTRNALSPVCRLVGDLLQGQERSVTALERLAQRMNSYTPAHVWHLVEASALVAQSLNAIYVNLGGMVPDAFTDKGWSGLTGAVPAALEDGVMDARRSATRPVGSFTEDFGARYAEGVANRTRCWGFVVYSAMLSAVLVDSISIALERDRTEVWATVRRDLRTG